MRCSIIDNQHYPKTRAGQDRNSASLQLRTNEKNCELANFGSLRGGLAVVD